MLTNFGMVLAATLRGVWKKYQLIIVLLVILTGGLVLNWGDNSTIGHLLKAVALLEIAGILWMVLAYTSPEGCSARKGATVSDPLKKPAEWMDELFPEYKITNFNGWNNKSFEELVSEAEFGRRFANCEIEKK